MLWITEDKILHSYAPIAYCQFIFKNSTGSPMSKETALKYDKYILNYSNKLAPAGKIILPPKFPIPIQLIKFTQVL